jgi:protease-4
VDEVGLGRVWTGRQALTRGLVDGHGDFLDAIQKAAELAALPTDDIDAVSVSNFFARSAGYVLPAARAVSILNEANRLLSGAAARELTGQPLMLLPTELRFR